VKTIRTFESDDDASMRKNSRVNYVLFYDASVYNGIGLESAS
jgi:hypothetical protein